MRITSGKYRNLKLVTLEGNNTRPTKEKVKMAIFNHLFKIKENGYALDIFAGSGNLGFEAISRGCKLLVSNDNNFKAYQVILKNAKNFDEKILIYNLDYKKLFDKIKDIKFDYIFLDPPYDFENLSNIFEMIYEYKILNDGGIIILEESVKSNFLTDLFEKESDKEYGITKISYYRGKK